MPDYDVVVIGAGNGGLTAAARLAKGGARVLVLERHNVPGGCATSFCRGRFEFEVALHQLTGMGLPENPGPLRRVLKSLGVLDRLEFLDMNDLYRLQVIHEDIDITLRPSREGVVAELQRRFPGKRRPSSNTLTSCTPSFPTPSAPSTCRTPRRAPRSTPCISNTR